MEDRELIVKTSAYIDRHRDEIVVAMGKDRFYRKRKPRIKRALTG